jgi:hypothetical protein
MVAVAALHQPLAAEDSTEAQVRTEAASLIVNSKVLGHLLFEKYRGKSPEDEALVRLAAKTALSAAGPDLCEGRYDVIAVPGDSVPFPGPSIPLAAPENILAYVIGHGSGDRPVMLGRSFRVELTPDGRTAVSVVASTTACAYESLAALQDARYIRDELAKAPTEFHVFLSLVHRAKFRVRAAMGVFEVADGAIRALAFDPDYRPQRIVVQDCRLPDGSTFTTTAPACRGAGGSVVE